ncbi:ABC-F family ATP-binding cassette domain-containing protein [Runella slithyformis]|uniref:ABC transporter related protein n=1 Tax=Runella slithyformis (strain ATCC 29530 / DSM 19594 / LMG 11500 / NCIMB 11436 / LSU 4) TaxID=761193 RepID=A0A7U3ZL61_RUNSL|nr:ABC-F family ATP-binding cassette domain-containing protein [Runella slithyformis]AEI49249.1 ABC transporter related protein [Runella slithyformis DSM 19594]
MNYLSAENISKSFGDKWLFKDLTLGLSRGDKMALIGANGTGKTTLMTILAGVTPLDKGSVSVRKDIRVGYLEQAPDFDGQLPVLEVLFSGNNPVAKAVKEYEEALLSGDDKRFAAAIEKVDSLQAWDFEARVKEILGKLGIPDVTVKIGTMSGGQRKRVALAKVLIESPDLLILDEPTNHLDLSMVEWLENYLNTQNTTLLLVTHDRYFLDTVCNVIVELDNGSLYTYKGNYAYFLEKKAEREAIEASEVDKARNLYRKELDWIRRQPKARGTKAKYRVDAFEDTKEKASQRKFDNQIELNVKSARLGSKIVELHSVGKRFGNRTVVNNFLYTFKKGDRIGIVGKNGAGKSTLLNMITGELRPDNGQVVRGDTVQFGYYKQTDLEYKDGQRVVDWVKDVAEVIRLGTGQTVTASQYLNAFLFPPHKQGTLIEKLSGGEKRRLQLLRILMAEPNFLILDEPTNDLDITTLNILEEFLMNFPGCLIIVSHDRYFLDRLVDHLFVFEDSGNIRDFPGNYTDYRNFLAENNDPKNDAKTQATTASAKSETPAAPTKRKLSYKEQKELESLEHEMAALEKQKAIFIEKLNGGSGSHEELTQWAKEIEQLNAKMEEKEMRWLELSEMG